MGKITRLITRNELTQLFYDNDEFYVNNPEWDFAKVKAYKQAVDIAHSLFGELIYVDDVKSPEQMHTFEIQTRSLFLDGDRLEKFQTLIDLCDEIDIDKHSRCNLMAVTFGFHLCKGGQ